jgi:hypothetical protein
MHEQLINTLRGAGWIVTLFDIGIDEACLVLAVKATVNDLFYLGRECAAMDVGAVFYNPGDKLAYFPAMVADAEDFKLVMA